RSAAVRSKVRATLTANDRSTSNTHATQSDPTTKIARLESALEASRHELSEAWAQQAALAEVLQLIDRSPRDLPCIFEAISDRAMKLCGATFGGLWLIERDKARLAAGVNLPKAFADFLTQQPIPLSDLVGRTPARLFLHVSDLTATSAYK